MCAGSARGAHHCPIDTHAVVRETLAIVIAFHRGARAARSPKTRGRHANAHMGPLRLPVRRNDPHLVVFTTPRESAGGHGRCSTSHLKGGERCTWRSAER